MVKNVTRKINLFQPCLGKEEAAEVTKVFESNWIGKGPKTSQFEENFALHLDSTKEHVLSTTSCTEAIFLTSKIFDFGQNDEIIVPTNSFSSVASSILESGAKIVFADCSKDKFTISPDDVRKKITKKTKIVSPTHLYGRPAEMDELRHICDQNNIYLIEDCCQATGAKYKNKMVGSIGHFNFHSFHNKLIASGEGGMITTNDKNLAERFEKLKNPSSANRPEERDGFIEISMNHRLSNLHAAVGLAQLERLEENIKKKIKMAEIYDEIFKDAEGIKIIKADSEHRTIWWRYTILLDQKINLNEFKQKALDKGIVIREGYLPLHQHPFFKDHNKLVLPNAEKLGKETIDIPSSFNLKEEEIISIGQNLKKIAENSL